MDSQPVRSRRATALLNAHGRAFAATARRFSICADDGEDALQRAVIILLTKGPPYPQERLAAWMHVVTRREAMAVRRERERQLPAAELEPRTAEVPCPAERFVRVEHARERARALHRLKPQERRALVLKGEGYSYAEICQLTGWSYTKVNRCLAEGRARLRELGSLG